jgi:hypothetical protein
LKEAVDRKTNFVLLHIIVLEREMSKYPEVDWSKVIRKAIIDCIHCKEISEVYTAPIERALSQEK